ncbi:MAG TPA: hydrogenase maturation nickel metallochaperone HypA [Nitrospinae bacterium]|nr:hydrogenase maturation nickel metallochaperone HypA [Nitrospinota bacterium]HBA27026.1 hydrogenase maturation nickel metallochaperone HypA [Nitrospinota bacterium]
MHELSIVQNILEIAESEARKNNAAKIIKVWLKIGEMSGVVADSITFCFEALKSNTIARDAELLIDHVPLTGRCKNCGNNFQISNYIFKCNTCNNTDIEIISGRELFVDELEVE